MGSTPCRVGWGPVGLWVESGTGRSRVGVRLHVNLGGVESGSGSSRGQVGVMLGSTPCQFGWGRVGVQVESGVGWGRVGVDSVSSSVRSGRGLGRVGDGSGSCWGRLRVKSGRVESGSGSSRGRIGVVLGPTPFQVGWGRVRVWMESGTGRGHVWVPVISDQSRRCYYLFGVTSFQHEICSPKT